MIERFVKKYERIFYTVYRTEIYDIVVDAWLQYNSKPIKYIDRVVYYTLCKLVNKRNDELYAYVGQVNPMRLKRMARKRITSKLYYQANKERCNKASVASRQKNDKYKKYQAMYYRLVRCKNEA